MSITKPVVDTRDPTTIKASKDWEQIQATADTSVTLTESLKDDITEYRTDLDAGYRFEMTVTASDGVFTLGGDLAGVLATPLGDGTYRIATIDRITTFTINGLTITNVVIHTAMDLVSLSESFRAIPKLVDVTFKPATLKLLTSLHYTFADCPELVEVFGLHTDTVTDFDGAFSNCPKLISVPEMDTSTGVTFVHMLVGVNTDVQLKHLDTSSKKEKQQIFTPGVKFANVAPVVIEALEKPGGFSLFNTKLSLLIISSTKPTVTTVGGTITISDSTNGIWSVRSDDAVSSFKLTGDDITKVLVINASTIASLEDAFTNLPKLTSVLTTVGGLSSVTSAKNMLKGCTSLTTTSLVFSSALVTAEGLFSGCVKLTGKRQFGRSNVMSGVTNFANMYNGCTALVTAHGIDTSTGTIFTDMFKGCTALTTLSQLNTVKAAAAEKIFEGCTALVQPEASIITALEASPGYPYMISVFHLRLTSPSTPTLRVSDGADMLITRIGTTDVYDVVSLDVVEDITDISTNVTEVVLLKSPHLTSIMAMLSGCDKLTSVEFKPGTLPLVTNAHTAIYNCPILSSVKGLVLPKCTDASFLLCKLGSDVTFDELYIPKGCTTTNFLTSSNNIKTPSIALRELMISEGYHYVNSKFMLIVASTTKPVVTGDGAFTIGKANAGYFTVSSNETITEFKLASTDVTSVHLERADDLVKLAETFKDLATLTKVVFGELVPTSMVDMTNLFSGCSTLTTIEGTGFVDTTKVTGLYKGCTALTHPAAVDTSTVSDFTDMFNGCLSLQALPLLNTSNGLVFDNIFKGCASITLLRSIDTRQQTSTTDMFDGCIKLLVPTAPILTKIRNGFNYVADSVLSVEVTSPITPTVYDSVGGIIDVALTGAGVYTLVSIYPVTSFKLRGNEITKVKFTHADTIVNCDGMCKGLPKLTSFNFNKIQHPCSFNEALMDCTELTEIVGSGFRATETIRMFSGCTKFTLVGGQTNSNISHLMPTGKADYMFEGCLGMKGNAVQWGTTVAPFYISTVKSAKGMFKNCTNMTQMDIQQLNVLTNIDELFEGCVKLVDVKLSNFLKDITTNATFKGCSSLLRFKGFNAPNITEMDETFSGCTALRSIGGLDTTSTNGKVTDLFKDTTALVDPSSDDITKLVATGGFTYIYYPARFIATCPTAPRLSDSSIKPIDNGDGTWTINVDEVHKNTYFYTTTGLTEIEILSLGSVTDFKIANRLNLQSLVKVTFRAGGDFSNVVNMNSAFNECRALKEVIGIEQIAAEDYSSCFSGCRALEKFPKFNLTKAKLFKNVFMYNNKITDIPDLVFPVATAIDNGFANMTNLTTVGDITVKTKSTFDYLFSSCKNLVTIGVLDFADGAYSNQIFYSCEKLTTIKGMDTTAPGGGRDYFSYAKNIVSPGAIERTLLNSQHGYKFGRTAFSILFNTNTKPIVHGTNATNITVADSPFGNLYLVTGSGDISGISFETDATRLDILSNVLNPDCSGIFANLTKLQSVTAQDAAFSTLINLEGMFEGCVELKSVPKLALTSATNIKNMFKGCVKLLTVPTFDLGDGVDASGLFDGCVALPALGSFATTANTTTTDMFKGCTALVAPSATEQSALLAGGTFSRLYDTEIDLVGCDKAHVNSSYNNITFLYRKGNVSTFGGNGVAVGIQLQPTNSKEYHIRRLSSGGVLSGIFSQASGDLVTIDDSVIADITDADYAFQYASFKRIGKLLFRSGTKVNNLFQQSHISYIEQLNTVGCVDNATSIVNADFKGSIDDASLAKLKSPAGFLWIAPPPTEVIVTAATAPTFTPAADYTVVDNGNGTFTGTASDIDITKLAISGGDVTEVNVINGVYIVDMQSGFSQLPELETFTVDAGTTLKPISASGAFRGCSKLTTATGISYDLVGNLDYLFYDCVKLTDCGEVKSVKCTSFQGTFTNCSELTNIPNISLDAATSLYQIFKGCTKLTDVTLPTPHKVITSLYEAFLGCIKLTHVKLGVCPIINNVTGLFQGCVLLETIDELITVGVQSGHVLDGCISLTSPDAAMVAKLTSSAGGVLSNRKPFSLVVTGPTKPQFNTATDGTVVANNDGTWTMTASSVGITDFRASLTDVTKLRFIHSDPIVKCSGTITGNMTLSYVDFGPDEFRNFSKGNSFFKGCTSLVEVGVMDVSSVDNMNNMFDSCTALRVVKGFKNVPKVDSYYVFKNTSNLRYIGAFDTTNLTGADYIFYQATLTHLQIPDAEHVTKLKAGFNWVPPLATALVITATAAPVFATTDGTITVDAPVNGTYYCSTSDPITSLKVTNPDVITEIYFKTLNVSCTTLTDAFKSAVNLTELKLQTDIFKSVTVASGFFEGCVKLAVIPDTIKVSVLTNASNFFKGCVALKEVNFKTGAVTNVSGLFDGCVKLTKVRGLNLTNVTDATKVFSTCGMVLTIDCYGFGDTAAKLDSAFADCVHLTNISYLDTTKVISKAKVLDNTPQLILPDAATKAKLIAANGFKFTVPNTLEMTVTGATITESTFSMYGGEFTLVDNSDGSKLVFSASTKFASISINSDCVTVFVTKFPSGVPATRLCNNLHTLTTFDAAPGVFSDTTDFAYMFSSCSSLATVGVFDTSKGTNFDSMFNGCAKLKVLPAFNFISATNLGRVIMYCTGLTEYHGINTGNAKTMQYFAYQCNKLLKMATLDTTSVTTPTSIDPALPTSIITPPDNIKKLLQSPGGFNWPTDALIEFTITAATKPVATGVSGGVVKITAGKTAGTFSLKATSTTLGFKLSGDVTKIVVEHAGVLVSTENMFKGLTTLTTFECKDTAFKYVTNFNGMFNGCTKLTHAAKFDTSNAVGFSSVYEGCAELLDAPKYDLAKATSINKLYSGCAKLVSIAGLDTTTGPTTVDVFKGCVALTAPSAGDQTKLKASGGFAYTKP